MKIFKITFNDKQNESVKSMFVLGLDMAEVVTEFQKQHANERFEPLKCEYIGTGIATVEKKKAKDA